MHKRLCRVVDLVDLPTYILASFFVPLMFVGLPNQSLLLTMVGPGQCFVKTILSLCPLVLGFQ